MGFTVEDYKAESLKAISFDVLVREFYEVEKQAREAEELVAKALEVDDLEMSFAHASNVGVLRYQAAIIEREAVRRDAEDGQMTPEEYMGTLGVVADALMEQQ